VLPLYLILAALFGWLEQEQRDAIEFLREENRVLKAQLHAGDCGWMTTSVGLSPPSVSALVGGSSRTSRRLSRRTRFSDGIAN
jgi:hypothetical protein